LNTNYLRDVCLEVRDEVELQMSELQAADGNVRAPGPEGSGPEPPGGPSEQASLREPNCHAASLLLPLTFY